MVLVVMILHVELPRIRDVKEDVRQEVNNTSRRAVEGIANSLR